MVLPNKELASTGTSDDKASSDGNQPLSITLPEVTSEVVLLKSIYEDGPPTAFFPYPSSVYFKQRISDRLYKQSGEECANLFLSFASESNAKDIEGSASDAGFAITHFEKKIEENPYFNVRVSADSNE